MSEVTESEVIPDVTEPVVTEPDITKPEVVSDVSESIPEPEVTEPDVTEPDVTEPEPVIEIILPAPDPLIIQLQDCTKFALFIGLNYNNQLVNRITTIDDAYTEITSKYNYDASNTLVLYEPNYEQLIKTLHTLVGYSPHLTEIIIYYSGYGTAQMDKVMIASGSELNQGNFVPEQRFCQTIDIVSILKSSCCKTMCVLDTCPIEPGIPIRWGADVYGHIKIIVIQESDELSTNKTALIQKMIQSYLHIRELVVPL